MSLRDLFSFGPVQFVWPWWVGGLILVAIWINRPTLRIAAVASPEVCAALFGALAGMLAAIARARYMRRAGAGRFLVFISIVLGAAVGYAVARFEFQPLTEQGCPCAPVVATRESGLGRTASYVLPVLLWPVWCRWLFAGLRSAPGTYDAASIVKLAQQLRRILPLRLTTTLLLIAAALVFVRMRVMPKDDLSVEQVIERMRGGGAAALLLASSPQSVQKVESLRQARAADAERRLAELDLDGARPLVRDAACTLVLPGKAPDANLAATEEAFKALDLEFLHGMNTYKPSRVSGRTLLALIPMRVEGNTARLPFLWSAARTPQEYSTAVKTGRMVGSYENHKVFDATIVMAQGSRNTRNVAVAMKLLGSVGTDSELADVVSRRLGVPTMDGVSSVGAGAMCAMWEVGNLRIRLGPATGGAIAPRADAQLWLTYYEAPVTERLRAANGMPAELAATYDCGSALQVQSH